MLTVPLEDFSPSLASAGFFFAGRLDQSKLLHLLADLVFVPAKKACGLRDCPAVGDLVP